MMGWVFSGLAAFGVTTAGMLAARAWFRIVPAVSVPIRRRRAALTPGHEALLCFGTLMAACEGRDLGLRCDRPGSAEWGRELAEGWGIRDSASARETLQGLLAKAQGGQSDEDFQRLQRNEPSVFDGEQRLRWQRAKRAWSRAGLSLPPGLSMAAHDHECIASLAKKCHECGYLTRSEFWLTLAWVAEDAAWHFVDWQAYAASFVMARAILVRQGPPATEVIKAMRHLLGGRQESNELAGLWRAHPLSGIRVDEVAIQSERRLARQIWPAQDSLLALGALIASSGGARVDRLAIAPEEHELHARWLATHWRAFDSSQVMARVDWLLDTGSRAKLDPVLVTSAGKPQAQGLRIERACRALLRAGHDPALIQGCRTLLAYDLERAAFGARLAFSAGLLDEERLRNALRHMARQARAAFDTWEQYLVSVILGHAMANEDWRVGKQLLHSGMVLLDGITPFAEFPSPWQACPLTQLPILHGVAPASVH